MKSGRKDEIGPAEETEYDKVKLRQTWTKDNSPEYNGAERNDEEVDHQSS